MSPPATNSDEFLPQAHHSNPGHCLASFGVMNRMRENSQLCDVKLTVAGEVINAHKVIISAASPYFYAMFNGEYQLFSCFYIYTYLCLLPLPDDMLESKSEVIELHEIDAPSLKQLIDFAYTGEIIITEENVQVLLPASSLLQIQSVRGRI